MHSCMHATMDTNTQRYKAAKGWEESLLSTEKHTELQILRVRMKQTTENIAHNVPKAGNIQYNGGPVHKKRVQYQILAGSLFL